MSKGAATEGKQRSLRSKFVRILLFVSGLIGASALGMFALTSAQTAAEHFAAVQGHIEAGIVSKGKVLTSQHALALRSLALDNAFLDMQRLVGRAVEEDSDLQYGVFVTPKHVTLAESHRGSTAGKDKLPVSDAWRALGLAPHELLVDKLSTKRVTRLGRDLLEVAAPVVSEDGELLGTVRYGLSTRLMHEALARAKSDSDGRLRNSVLLIGGLVSAATLLGLLLSRAQAVRVIKPVEELMRAAEDLAQGKHSVRVNIDSGDELELLGHSFNRMVEQLDASYGALHEMNRTLEQKVEDRTAELAVRNRDMLLVLNNVDQGFITLSPSGIVSGESSRIAKEWFGEHQQGTAFADCLAATSAELGENFALAWSQLEEGFLPLEVCLSQLPARFTSGAKTWSLRYLPFHKKGELEGVLVVVADITERLAREREDAEHDELISAFKNLMPDRGGFLSFLREASGMVDEIGAHGTQAATASLRRTLHTLKGNCGVMGLRVVARICHTLEDELAEHGSMSETTLAGLTQRWTAINEHIAQVVGTGVEPLIEISESEFGQLASRVARDDCPPDVLPQLQSWRLEPAARSLQRLGGQAKALAYKLGKGDINVEIRAPGLRLDPGIWGPFYSELTHVVRNSIDHGLETPEQRAAAGKKERPTLFLAAVSDGNGITFEVADNGRGIDWRAIAAKAKQRGLPHQTPSNLLSALCTDGISSRGEVTDVSGRGVGMAAFKACVETLHGRVEVTSSGDGTKWTIRFPITEYRAGVSAA